MDNVALTNPDSQDIVESASGANQPKLVSKSDGKRVKKGNLNGGNSSLVTAHSLTIVPSHSPSGPGQTSKTRKTTPPSPLNQTPSTVGRTKSTKGSQTNQNSSLVIRSNSYKALQDLFSNQHLIRLHILLLLSQRPGKLLVVLRFRTWNGNCLLFL